MIPPPCPRFSEHFGINQPQHDLDFVDILLETDLTLYLDPYAFKVGSSNSAVKCNNLVVDFFDTVLDCICSGRHDRGRKLLDNLHEPDQTRLGVSTKQSCGRGLGCEQASTLYDRLANSKAAKTGMLRDLTDCELMIPGISQDKISDITTNIVRAELAEFTKAQCLKHGVPVRPVERGVAWLEDQHAWKNDYARLPIYKGESLLLVPKWMVRRNIAVDHHEYYGKFVLEFLRQEHLHTGSGLVEVLKNGKQRVTKKSLKQEYPLSKDWLLEFSEKHPEVFKKYHDYLNNKLSPMNSSELEELIRSAQQNHGGSPVILNLGDMTMGDRIRVDGNVSGSVIGAGTINARDITVYSEAVNNSALDPNLKKVLLAARAAVETSGLTQTDKADVSDDLGRITAELKKPVPEPGLVRRYFNRIKEVAGDIATILSSAKVIKDVVTDLAA